LLRRSLCAFDVQVRVGYLGLLRLGRLPGLGLLHQLQFVGVNALLLAGHCPIARLPAPVERGRD
jgi:hypothetical protein